MFDQTVRIYQDPRARGATPARFAQLFSAGLPISEQARQETVSKLIALPADAALPEEVISSLQQDPGMMLAVLRKVRGDAISNPLVRALSINCGTLRSVLTSPAALEATSSLKQASRVQRSALVHTATSAKAAVEISEHLDPEIDLVHGQDSFLVSWLSTIGETLLRWHHPRVVVRAQGRNRGEHGVERDSFLQEHTGFSPRGLSYAVARELGVGGDLLRAVAGNATNLTTGQPLPSAYAETLSRVTRLSVAFAETLDPVSFPQARLRWEALRPELVTIVGEQGTGEIEGTVHFAHETAKETLGIEITPASIRIPQHQGNRQPNLVVPEKVQQAIDQTIALTTTASVSIAAVESLISSVIPQAGFIYGCVYLLSPDQTKLLPAVEIGSRGVRQYSALDIHRSDPVVQALFSAIPVQQQLWLPSGETASRITGSFQSSSGSGVLVLELPNGGDVTSRFSPVTVFKAITRCLERCLGKE